MEMAMISLRRDEMFLRVGHQPEAGQRHWMHCSARRVVYDQ